MIWKDIPSFEGLYKISEYGDILNIKPTNSKNYNYLLMVITI